MTARPRDHAPQAQGTATEAEAVASIRRETAGRELPPRWRRRCSEMPVRAESLRLPHVQRNDQLTWLNCTGLVPLENGSVKGREGQDVSPATIALRSRRSANSRSRTNRGPKKARQSASLWGEVSMLKTEPLRSGHMI